MIDQNKFINTYIDIIINALLENIKTNLQLQTQVKCHEFVVAEKDQQITSLTQRLNENVVAEDWKQKYDAAEANYNAVLGKLSHMDGLLNQVGEMKNQILAKDVQISNIMRELEEAKAQSINLTKELEEAKAKIVVPEPVSEIIPTAKKVINSKVTKTPVAKETEKDIKLDDF